jgi:hypothetical protein
MSKFLWVFLSGVVLAGLLVWGGCSSDNSSTATGPESVTHPTMDVPPPQMDTPIITCVSATTVSIDIQVCAGATGNPAGFTLQWMTAADFAANGNMWYGSDDPRLCKGSFSGNANLSRYNLNAGECVTVNIGEFLFDNGASTNCATALVCETDYVFHAFAHANSSLHRSDWTADLTCSTLPCNETNYGCTYTQGYWKTHGPLNDTRYKDPGQGGQWHEACTVPTGYSWPLDPVKLGANVYYSSAQVCAIFNTSAGGNGLISLAHQLIAAKFNAEKNGAVPPEVQGWMNAADALIGNLVVPPAGAGWLAPGTTGALTGHLTDYNEGNAGVGHCD